MISNHKIGFRDFFGWFLAAKEWIAIKWIEIDQDHLRTGIVIGVSRALAHISCLQSFGQKTHVS